MDRLRPSEQNHFNFNNLVRTVVVPGLLFFNSCQDTTFHEPIVTKVNDQVTEVRRGRIKITADEENRRIVDIENTKFLDVTSFPKNQAIEDIEKACSGEEVVMTSFSNTAKVILDDDADPNCIGNIPAAYNTNMEQE